MNSIKQTKEDLLKDINQLLSYGKEEPTINPKLLVYMDEASLISIKKGLLSRVGILSDADKIWLEQFKKYE